jgi:nucleotide-binding universal stress UspA family protein
MPTERALSRNSKILVATDLSARSDRAVERAFLLAKQIRASLTILHVVDTSLPSRIADRLHDDARAAIADHVAALADANSVPWDIIIVLGNDHKDIVEHAESLQADLIVLGIHRNESRELFRGTTAERVVRTGRRPVLMVKTRPQGFYRRVVIGVDFSDCSRHAIQFATQLIVDGEFHLVHAFDVPFAGFLSGDDTQREALNTHQKQLERLVAEEFSALQAALHATSAGLYEIVRRGAPEQVIREQVSRLKPDLLVLGTHGRSGIAHAMLGSVAEEFLSNPPCDVLVVRP